MFIKGRAYRRHDLVGKDGQLFSNHQSLENAIRDLGFPPGRTVARIRVWSGDELIPWWENRSTEKIEIPEGFGGTRAAAKSHEARKRKQAAAVQSGR